MSPKTVNMRYGFFMLITALAAMLSYDLGTWMTSDHVLLLMLLVCIVWFNTIRYRVVFRELQYLLCTMSVMLAMLLMTALLKFSLVNDPVARRYLDYLYQLPVMACSVISFFTAQCVGVVDIRRTLKKRLWLIPVCLLIVAGYLTNDLHHLAYRNILPDGNLSGNYILCYISWAFQIIMYAATFFTILRRSRISNIRRYIWLPLLFLAIGGALLLASAMTGGLHIGGIKIYFQSVFVFMLIGFWETCIIIGLVPSNSRYIMLMNSLPINMQISDSKGNLSSDSAVIPITPEQRSAAVDAPVMLDGYIQLNAKSIPGGYMYWTEDRSRIEKLNDDLRKRIERLREQNEELQRENSVKAEKARYEVQNRTYSTMADELQPTADKIRELLAEGDIAYACVLGTYIKRRANLFLLSEQSPQTDISELYHSVRESLESLKLLDITCSVYTEGAGNIPSRALLEAYDFFEQITESKISAMNAVMVLIGAKDGTATVTINISGDDTDDDEGCFTASFGGGEQS